LARAAQRTLQQSGDLKIARFARFIYSPAAELKALGARHGPFCVRVAHANSRKPGCSAHFYPCSIDGSLPGRHISPLGAASHHWRRDGRFGHRRGRTQGWLLYSLVALGSWSAPARVWSRVPCGTSWSRLSRSPSTSAECFRLEETAGPSGRQHDVERRTAGQHGHEVARVFQG